MARPVTLSVERGAGNIALKDRQLIRWHAQLRIEADPTTIT